ncbi:MAG: MotA/TolQ/ExbB proton channel family protein [Pirellulaceae bacterium]|nr:MotA/TolQ/ExbB proton channel family protein [Pirellulaceae bacterium]
MRFLRPLVFMTLCLWAWKKPSFLWVCRSSRGLVSRGWEKTKKHLANEAVKKGYRQLPKVLERILKRCNAFQGAAVLLGLTLLGVIVISDPGDRLYAFILDRSCVQLLTLYVACLVALLLSGRAQRYRQDRVRFQALKQGNDRPPAALAEQLSAVHAASEQGVAAATACAKRLAQRQQEGLDKDYDAVHFLAGCLPALGLFGTMLGLSRALFTAFSAGSLEADSVQTFVTALSTAMDTTVLAMACAVPLFAAAWGLRRLENELADQNAAYIRDQFDLEELAAADRTPEVLQAELRKLTRRMAKEVRSTFDELLRSSADTFRESLQSAVQEVFAPQRERDATMVREVARHLTDSVTQSARTMGELVQQHNTRMAEDMIDELGQLKEALHNRTPEEVIIRYRDKQKGRSNGRAKTRELTHA